MGFISMTTEESLSAEEGVAESFGQSCDLDLRCAFANIHQLWFNHIYIQKYPHMKISKLWKVVLVEMLTLLLLVLD